MRHFFICLAAILCAMAVPVFLAEAAAPETDEAQQLYQAYGDALYQVQVIDRTSGKKNSIGSGFQFTRDGLIATNYHVIAEALQRPADNHVEFLHDRGEKGQLEIVIADVVHDLAILRMNRPGKKWLELGTSKLPKGVKLFSLGNPHDIGFTIIEGTYSGLMKESFIEKIHFSGSLNPGMSGGPAIGHDGAVAGINVATAGNQISFLVPVEPLHRLLADYRRRQPAKEKFTRLANTQIMKQLVAAQDGSLRAILKKKWESVNFGPMMVPGRIHDALKCWGGTLHKDKDSYQHFYSICSTQDRMFLDNDFDTGTILYRYDYLTDKDDLSPKNFYSLYESRFSFPLGDFSNAGEGNVSNFDCNSGFIRIAGQRWKSNFCVRQYKKYFAIYDLFLNMALLDDENKGLIVSLSAQGVSKQNALALAGRFMKEIKTKSSGKSKKKRGSG